MVSIREFVTAIEDAFDPEPDKGVPMKIHAVECAKSKGEPECSEERLCRVLYYFKPNDGQFALYIAATGRHASDNDRMGAVVNFFVDIFDKPSQEYLTERLLDRDDPFGLPKIEEIMEAVFEEWTGRPTQRPRGSTPSRTSGGRNSTRPTRKSTSSGKALTGS